jgi:hypothetical protein
MRKAARLIRSASLQLHTASYYKPVSGISLRLSSTVCLTTVFSSNKDTLGLGQQQPGSRMAEPLAKRARLEVDGAGDGTLHL